MKKAEGERVFSSKQSEQQSERIGGGQRRDKRTIYYSFAAFVCFFFTAAIDSPTRALVNQAAAASTAVLRHTQQHRAVIPLRISCLLFLFFCFPFSFLLKSAVEN